MIRPNVFLVDDHELIRVGIKAEIKGEFEIVGEADEVEPAIEMICERQPDVVLLDVHMPGGGGLRILQVCRSKGVQSRFLALSVSDSEEDVIAVVRAGASGYLTKNVSGLELIESIWRVHGGDAVFSPRLAGFALEAFSSSPDAGNSKLVLDPDLDQLTTREREVLRYIARGFSYKLAAAELQIAPKTVESHVSSVLRKLQLTNRYQLSHWAMERKLD